MPAISEVRQHRGAAVTEERRGDAGEREQIEDAAGDQEQFRR